MMKEVFQKDGFKYGLLINPKRYILEEDLNDFRFTEKVYSLSEDKIINFDCISGLSIKELKEFGVIKDQDIAFIMYSTVIMPNIKESFDEAIEIQEKTTLVFHTHIFSPKTLDEKSQIEDVIGNYLTQNACNIFGRNRLTGNNLLRARGFLEKYLYGPNKIEGNRY